MAQEPQVPLIDRAALEKAYNYSPQQTQVDLPNIPFKGLNTTLPNVDGQITPSALSAIENHLLAKPSDRRPLTGGGISRSLKEVTSNRYDTLVPGDYNNEDAYAQGQGWVDKMVNGVGKGLVLTGTTFLQSTAGLLNGVVNSINDGRAASFYDNDFNRALDELNKQLEDQLPNYYKDVEKNARWYSPTKLFTGNFFWDGIVKNLGFAAGAALSGQVYAAGLRALPLTSRLFSVGKAAETLAATEEGLLAANKVADTYGKVRGLSDQFLSSYSALNTGGRALVAGLATTGEAGFEAFHNLNQFRDEKIEEYKALNNGREPIGADLDKINMEADHVGNSSFLLNTALLSATNYIQFPKILGSSYTAEKGLINSLKSDISAVSKNEAGQFIAPQARTLGGKLLSGIKTVAPYTFSASEGFEEGAQFAISIGTQDYYNKKYDGDVADVLDSMAQGITQTIGTDEGMENILIGGLSGALMLGRGKFKESVERSKNTADAIQKFNKWQLSDFTKDTIDSVNRGTVLQQERETALRQGDILESKEKEADYIINYLTPRIKYGRFDLITADINDYKELASTEQGFAQLQSEGKVLNGDTREAYILRLANLEDTAKNVKSLYQSLNLRYGGNAAYTPAVIDQMIYAASKVADYDKRLPSLSLLLMENAINSEELFFDGKINQENIDKAVSNVNKLNVNSDIKDEIKSNLRDYLELSLRRDLFIKEYDDIKKSPEKYQVKDTTPVIEEEDVVEVKQAVPGTRRSIPKEIEVGKQYSLSQPIRREGNTIQVSPKLSVVSSTLGGEFETILPSGEVVFLSPAKFKEYEISDVSNDSEQINQAVSSAIDEVLTRSKYKEIPAPTGDKIAYVNSLDNKKLIDDILKEVDAQIEEFKKQQEQALKLAKNKALLQQVLGTHTSDIENNVSEGEYQPEKKKDDNAVINGTVAVDDGKPHQKRANTFGINLPNLENRDKLRALEITAKTEAKAGIPGLIEHLITGTTIDKNSVVAVVFVQDDGNEQFSFVDENGEVIKTSLLDKAIYQVRPREVLELNYGSGPETMFRDSTSKETQEELKKRYAAHRDFVLKSEVLQPMKEFNASFGILKYEQISNDKGQLVDNFGAENSVLNIGFVTEDDFAEKENLLEVSTLNDPTPENGVSFKNFIGRVLLRVPGVGMLKLNTSKLGKKRVENIYSAILQVAKNVNEDTKNGVKKSEPLFSWLKTVVYWGIPKNLKTDKRTEPTYNNVWFEQLEDDTTRLFISGRGGNFIFTPSSIEANKEQIVLLLENMYHNVSNSELKKGLKKYRELIGFDKEGAPEYKTWENYQTYLVSEKAVTTPVLAVKGDEQNREGIYFVLQNSLESEVVTAPKEQPKAEGLQVYTSPEGKKINYLVEDGNVILKSGADLAEVMQKVKPIAIANNPGKTSDEVKAIVVNSIQERIKASLPSTETKPKRSIFGKKTEQKPAKIEQETPTPAGPKRSIFNMSKPASADDEVYRLQVAQETDRFEGEDWKSVEKWLKDNFPNVPVYRVKNAIAATNGRQAWGMLHKGAIYLSKKAETGTAYHEVFESVWKMLTPKEEQSSVLDEFKNRKGTFINKFTGETVKYSEASVLDSKEQLAEEFRDYILSGKIPAKPTVGKSFIVKLFADIYNFFKAFFTGEKAQTNTANLFSKIGNGYYKNIIPYESGLSFAKNGIVDIDDVVGDETSDYRLQNVPYVQKHELMQHMTYSTLAELIKNNASLFGVSKINKKDLYSFLKDEILSVDFDSPGILNKKASALQQNLEAGITTQETTEKVLESLESLHENIAAQWDQLVEEHTIYLKQYAIEFDENDNIVVENEDKDKGADGYADTRKVDYFRKANPAVKMLLATIPQVQTIDNKIGFKRSSIGGITTLPLDRTFITLKNKLYNSLDIEDMMNKLREIAKEDPNYNALYRRLTKESAEGDDKINFLKLTEPHDIELLASFYKAMRAQNPDVKIVYMLPSGEVEIGDAHLADATRQAKADMFGDIVSKLKAKSPYISFNTKEKEYNATDVIKKLTLKPGNKDGYVAFLKAIGVDFNRQELNTLEKRGQYKAFEDAVNGVKASIESISKVKDLNKYTINLEGRLSALGAIRAALINPDFESTYFSISGERTQTYIGTNTTSDFYDVISRIDNIRELSNTPYAFLLTDEFAKNSVILNSIFNLKTGNKKEGAQDILSTGIVEGIIDTPKGKSKEASNVTSKDRLIEELNLNHKGWFLNLVPGDASIEWMVKMFNDKRPFISASDLEIGYNEVFDIFKGYFISEVNVAREERTIPSVKGRNSSDLRFFKALLGTELHDKIMNNSSTAEKIYNDNKAKIDGAVREFVKKEAKDTLVHLKDYGIVKYGETGMEVENLSFAPENISEEKLLLELEASQANYMIANIEFHKLIYSDPYFYKDELKRIKNFNSPAQPLMSSTTINKAISTVYNKRFNKNTLGWTNFNVNFLVSTTLADVSSFINDLKGYEEWEETDGGGIVTMQANRNIRIRAANWNEQEEKQYIHDIGYERLVKSGASEDSIEEYEKKNPSVKSAYTPIKPIVRGSKADGKSYNDVILDKFALTPFSFRILHKMSPNSNAIKHYEKMVDTGVDYTVFKTGRKVGAGFENPLYNEDGSYNTAPFVETNEIPFSIISIQTEVPSKDKPEVTQGSQVTKLATMDFMDAGVPLDFEASGKLEDRFAKWTLLKEAQKEKASPLYKLIKHNETLLVERIQHGYNTLLNKLGIEQKGNSFKINDIDKLIETLTDEIYKREVNDNIIEAFKGFKSGQVVLEATPAYQQIRNILYSIANKQVTRPTISGGLKVQIPSTLLETTRPVGKKGMYESSLLKFYEDEDGQRVAEIMVGRWFKSDLSDQDLLKYLNETEEGKKILSGVGFRIPTQKQNSIDAFRIKEFLPSEFGDSVVIPSALVKKVGSDFDIDKLSLYFKNTYINLKGQLKLIPFLGYGEQAKAKFAQMYDDGEFLKEKDRAIVNKWIRNRKKQDKDEVVENLFKAMFGEEKFDDTYIQETIDDFLEAQSTEEFKQKVVNEKYKQSLENEYIQSLEDLVSHPLNYERLISPNSADQLKKLSNQIVKKLGFEEIDYTSVGNMFDRNFMERLRQAFVRGKYAIGIAATSQTNNAQNQRTVMTIDYDKLKEQTADDQKWLGDGIIKFKQFNKIDNKPTLSLARNANGQLISDIIGQFIDGYVDISKGPWIMELGATPNTASTWLFLIKLGVPIDTVAYFMNQPIIREHLKSIENAGYSWVFNNTIADQVRDEFSSKVEVNTDILPSQQDLEKTVGKKELSEKEKAQQLFILDEFLKYSKLAEQLFHIQQGSNFDTANINDPYIAFKKRMQLEKARTMMISSVDSLLDNSFVGKLKDTIFDIRDAFSTILISDKVGVVRNTLEQVLFPYVESNDRDFVKISQKAVFDLFDWAVQTNQELNSKLSTILLGKEDRETAADEIMSFIKEVKADKSHPLNGNYIIESLKQTRDSVQENKPHNLYVTGKNNKIYDQNNVIYGFSEIRSYLENQGDLSLYTKLVDLAVLQSGLTNSRISFTSLLPYEDFKDIYNDSLSILDKMANLQDFVALNVLERNNWNNPDIVSSKKSQWLKLKEPFTDFQTGQLKQWVKVPEIEFLNKNLSKAVKLGKIPQVIQLSPFTKEGREEFVNFTWESDISKKKKQEMRKKGDYSYIKKGLFKKVHDSNGLPLVSTYVSKKTGKEYSSVIFKAVNAWGDSFRANEFYTVAKPSIIDNGFIKVKEVDDATIEKALFPKKQAVYEGTDQIPKCL